MLTNDTIDGTNIVTVSYSGSVTTEEVQDLRSVIDEVVDRDGGVRLLIQFEDVDLGRIEPKAWVEDLKLNDVMGDAEKIALITDASWIQTAANLLGGLASGEVQTFDPSKRDESLVWLRG